MELSIKEEAPREPTPEPPIQEVNLLHFTPLGGIFYYDLYHLPPQSHIVHGWEIRQVSICCELLRAQFFVIF